MFCKPVDSFPATFNVASFIQKGSFDYDDIMSRWLRWLNNGEYTPNGLTFGVGHTSCRAIKNYALRKEPLKCGLKGEYDNGNGAMMRMLPLALYAYKLEGGHGRDCYIG